ncbi:aromatic ring-hydroxylating oxygenase subunit alpha [Caulobacter sp. DWR1-3-2b1]|uniref:aromatic ring-hydroxylating oxygenase subunit alpha n=1 Tax=Caulobacter sp. DWR1-3-2b1 TaxID=2804670 RepID=UPI003CF8C807
MTKMGKIAETAEDLVGPVTVPAEAYVSRDYARAEQDRLWRKTWLQAGRIEEIPEVGSFITYDIGVDSVIITRTGPDEIRAYHNVCPHRGRRLIDTPSGKRNASGKRMSFVCGFHAWTFNLEGRCTYIEHKDDWQGALSDERTSLGKVQVDAWGGWIWINLDPDCAPLSAYLDPIPAMLGPFETQNMRFRWRKWIVFNCNWKVAMEAFCETYHVSSTHPEFMEFGQFRGWARNHGLHTNIGYDAPKDMEEDAAKLRLGTNGDPRITTAELQNFTWANANTNTTQTLVDAANRLKDELPEGTPGPLVFQHWLKSAREHDATRGVVWPVVEPSHTAKAGTAWQVFPNFQIGQAVNNMLCYGAKPYGEDPDMCIFEAAVYELFPQGGEPETEWEYTKSEDWPPVLQQDFANMQAVQQGMKNVGFRGTQPNPYMERSVASLHYNLSRYMGTDAPRSIE